jgi:hypothetical protein
MDDLLPIMICGSNKSIFNDNSVMLNGYQTFSKIPMTSYIMFWEYFPNNIKKYKVLSEFVLRCQ